MTNHQCYIGLYCDYEDSELVTLEGLRSKVKQDWQLHIYRIENNLHIGRPPHRLIDYLDKRKSTCLTRFSYCPVCGEPIDWKQLRANNKESLES